MKIHVYGQPYDAISLSSMYGWESLAVAVCAVTGLPQ